MKPAGALKLAGLVSTLVLVSAPARASTVGSAQTAYITGAPIPYWLGLATPEGRDAIQLGSGCDGVVPGVNVVQLASEGSDPKLQVVDPILGLQSDLCLVIERRHMSDAPCAKNPAGLCDVAFS